MNYHFLLFQLALAGYFLSFLLLVSHFLFSPDKKTTFAKILLTAAVLSHLVSLVLRGVTAGHTPVANFFESMNQFIFFIALVAVWQLWRSNYSFAGVFPMLILLICSYFTLRIDPKITEMYPALQSIWFEVHVISAFISYALFTMGAGLSIFYFIRRKKNLEFINRRMPAYLILDKTAYRQNA